MTGHELYSQQLRCLFLCAGVASPLWGFGTYTNYLGGVGWSKTLFILSIKTRIFQRTL